MAYDARAESVTLIETRRLQPVRSLSRRRRFAAMAVDVADDIAATLFLRRSVGRDMLETWVLTHRQTPPPDTTIALGKSISAVRSRPRLR